MEHALHVAEQRGDRTEAGERSEGARCREQRQGMAGRWRVEQDEIVRGASEPSLLEPAGHAVEHEQLRQPRRRGRQHLEGGALEESSGEQAEAECAQDEIAEHGFRLEARDCELRADARRLVGDRRGPEQRTQPPRADLDRQHASPRRRRGLRERGRHRRLADSTLSRNDDQALGS